MNNFNDSVMEVLNMITQKPSTSAIIISLLWSTAFTVFLWFAYRFANTEKTYQPKFAATLVSLAIVSTVLMDLIRSNLALSLGMLGSLSIVRFRTTIKDPRDIGFIFWAMAIGLASATGSYTIGIVGSIILGMYFVISSKFENNYDEMMLVIRGSNTDITSIGNVVNSSCVRNSIKAKNILSDSYEIVYEVKIEKNEDDKLINKLFDLAGIDSVNLLSENKLA